VTAPQQIDPEAFNALEREGWAAAASAYADSFNSLTTQAVGPLLDSLHVARGVRLLDVACGPGWLSAAAAERGARVIGIDITAAMVAAAGRRYPHLEFREGSAEELPFDSQRFDSVAMNFGLLHLGRPDQALREASRVLMPGGRGGFTVWATPDRAIGFGILLDAVAAHGQTDVGLPPGPPFFRFSDPGELEAALVDAGFSQVIVSELPLVWRLPSAERFFDAMTEGTVRTRALLRAQTPEALATIRRAVVEGVTRYRTADGVQIPMPAVLATAVKR
jgi:SAM-dependent methyltransferase